MGDLDLSGSSFVFLNAREHDAFATYVFDELIDQRSFWNDRRAAWIAAVVVRKPIQVQNAVQSVVSIVLSQRLRYTFRLEEDGPQPSGTSRFASRLDFVTLHMDPEALWPQWSAARRRWIEAVVC